ncbi:MAG: holo-ACP synthase [Betaproteobacteria bacterium HGW-Betaproteobacteria-11]|nr:MAG: holo-ACP synthase [Betaproteobacteria bacterium HGW-Betaproteobacteria-11]
MIFGIGTDIVAVARMEALWQRHGERAADKLLASEERQACLESPLPARFLAKRFAAKEALGKALGIGVRSPFVLPNVAVTHDALGKPAFAFAAEPAAWLAERGLCAHLSLADETDYAVAFVLLETT